MINFIFYVKEKRFIGFKAEGHSNFYKKIIDKETKKKNALLHKKDYICSAVSSVSYMCVIGIGNILKKKIFYKETESGFMECRLLTKPNKETEVFFYALYKTLLEIENSYPGNINIIKEEKYGS